MSDQSNWDIGKLAGIAVTAVASAATALRYVLKDRNASHAARIFELERIKREDRRTMAELRASLEEVQLQIASNVTRLRRVEITQSDQDRDIRDTLQQMIEKIDRRLHHEGVHREAS
jgi:uncharacterized protein HemX